MWAGAYARYSHKTTRARVVLLSPDTHFYPFTQGIIDTWCTEQGKAIAKVWIRV